jgi:hypothetical protein
MRNAGVQKVRHRVSLGAGGFSLGAVTLALALTAAPALGSPLRFEDGPLGPVTPPSVSGLRYQLSTEPTEDTVRVSRASSWLSYRLVGAAKQPIRVRGASATLRAPFSRTDEVFTATATRFSDDLILRRGARVRAFAYRVHTSPDLSVHTLSDGGVGFFRGKRLRLAILPPRVGSTGSPHQPARKPRYRVRAVGDGYALRLVIQTSWLRTVLKRGAVVIDPDVGGHPLPIEDPPPQFRLSSEPGCTIEQLGYEPPGWFCFLRSPDAVDDQLGINGDLTADPQEDAYDAPSSPTDADSLASPYPEDYTDPTSFQTTMATTPGLAELALAGGGHHSYDIHTVYSGESSGVTYLMRWGSASFGYRHLVARRRWSARTDARIATAFSNPYSKSYEDTTTFFYVYVQGSRKCLFKVVYQNRIANDLRPKGLITAYPVNGTGCKSR